MKKMDLGAVEEIVVRYRDGRPAQVYRGNGLGTFINRIVSATAPEHVYDARRGKSYLVVGDMTYTPSAEEISRAQRITTSSQ